MWIVQWSVRTFLFGNSAFGWFWPHVICMLVVCQPELCCMCVCNKHAHSANSFAVDCTICFQCLILGPSGEYYSPRKDFRAWLWNILAANILVYRVVHIRIVPIPLDYLPRSTDGFDYDIIPLWIDNVILYGTVLFLWCYLAELHLFSWRILLNTQDYW
jgi:hypothetical protein